MIAAALIRLVSSLADGPNDDEGNDVALASAARGMIRLCSDGGSAGLAHRAAVLTQFAQRSAVEVAARYCTEAVLRLRDAAADEAAGGGFDSEAEETREVIAGLLLDACEGSEFWRGVLASDGTRPDLTYGEGAAAVVGSSSKL